MVIWQLENRKSESLCLDGRFIHPDSLILFSELPKEENQIQESEMDGHNSEEPKESTADMSAFVQDLLQQMQCRFQAMSHSIVTKIDDMGTRINDLEQSINDLKAEMGMEGSPSPVAASKPNADGVKQEEGSA